MTSTFCHKLEFVDKIKKCGTERQELFAIFTNKIRELELREI